MSSSERKVRKLLALGDITIDGAQSYDIQVHNKRLYSRILAGGRLALGESYMDGWWDVQALDQFIDKILTAQLHKKVHGLGLIFFVLKARILNLQNVRRAFQVGEEHYDVGNDLYRAMLDKRMTYTCGYWSGNPPASGLDEAQEAKLDLVCRKIGLKKGDRVLDIGGGWGSFAKFAVEKYGAEVVAITVSKEQAALGRELTKGLPVEIRLQDYRDLNEQFDHIVSLGMFEHVGYKNYRHFMEIAYKSLKDGGLFLLHTIGSNKTVYASDPWFDKYIFPNGMLPSVKQLGASFEELFVMEDWHNFGADYDKTLMEWFANFDSAWPMLKKDYDDRFYRMWKYYLLSSAGAFRSRQNNQLWQIVLSKKGVRGGHKRVS